MDNATIIAMVESVIPENVLNGNYIHNGINVPLKPFLEDILANFITEGQTVDQVKKYVDAKILPNVVPLEQTRNVTIDFGPLANQDVQSYKANETQVPLPEVPTIEDKDNSFIPINPMIGKQLVDDFIKNRVGFVENVRTSDVAIVNTREYLYSKISFMNSEGKIIVGDAKKDLDEVYNILLNNSYKPANMVDKTELCMYFADRLEPEILTSIIPGLNVTTLEYIRDVMPKMMVNATDIAVGNKMVTVDVVIDKIAENQRKLLDSQKSKEVKQDETLDIQRKAEDENNLEKFNRTSENPSLLSEIKLELGKEDESVELTAEIPIVSSLIVSPEEIEALSSFENDRLYSTDSDYYRSIMNDLKQSIKNTGTEHDLTAKESGNNNYSFNTIAQEALKEIPTFEMQQLINSTSEMIGSKRNEIIKTDSNREDYCDSIIGEINSISRKLELADSTDAFSDIKNEITHITMELVTKKILDIRVKNALDALNISYRHHIVRYKLTKGNFEKEKNRVVENLNDRMSEIRRNYTRLVHIYDNSQSQRVILETNMGIESLKGDIQNALASHYLTEEEANQYYYELNRMNTLGTAKNRLG